MQPQTQPQPSQPSKALWAAICVLAIAVAALGGALVHKEVTGSATATAPTPASTAVAAAPPAKTPDDFPGPPPVQAVAPPPPAAPAQAPAPPPVRAPEVIPPKVVQANPAGAASGSAPAPAPVKPCSVCGHVESVRKVERQQPTSGVGAVAGGVVGGLVGNQIGSGNGRTAATVLGAVGGGFAGNSIEKHTHTKTVYDVSVRMQDGSVRRVETSTAPPIGKAVTLKGNVLRPADGRK